MLHQKHVRVKIGDPLLAFLRDAKIAQGIPNIWLHHLPEKSRIICPQIGGSFVLQLFHKSSFTKLVEQRRRLAQVVDVRQLPDQVCGSQ